jgi:hypothetical protein
MDYRCTEDFARRMEAAELRARLLRAQAIDDFFAAVARVVRQSVRRLVHTQRSDKLLET